MGRSSVARGAPREVFLGLVLPGQAPAAGCAPAAALHRPLLLLSAPGREAQGCGNMVPARRGCDLPGSPAGTPALCSSFSFFSTFRFNFPPLPLLPGCSVCSASLPLSTHSSCLDLPSPPQIRAPQAPLLPARLSPASLASTPQTSFAVCLPRPLPFSPHRPSRSLSLPAALPSLPPAPSPLP